MQEHGSLDDSPEQPKKIKSSLQAEDLTWGNKAYLSTLDFVRIMVKMTKDKQGAGLATVLLQITIHDLLDSE